MQLNAVLPTDLKVEVDAAILQAVVTLGLVLYCAFLHRRYRKEYFLWFSSAWTLYFLRIGAITAFVLSQNSAWLYWHQVLTGWTALALLWAALVFSRQLRFRARYLLALLFPLGWSYIAIYLLDNFLGAALPTVLFLAAVTAWTGAIFFRHWRSVRAPGAAVLSASLFLWAVHHLDYPFLRARGAWNPWGYYLDIAFLRDGRTQGTIGGKEARIPQDVVARPHGDLYPPIAPHLNGGDPDAARELRGVRRKRDSNIFRDALSMGGSGRSPGAPQRARRG